MKHLLILALLAIFSAGAAQALEPRSYDQFGNPEEPALRPYKWIFHGLKGLVYHPGKSFVDGNMKTPVLGTVETTRGVRRGAIRLGEATWNGILYRPVPDKGEFKDMGPVNEAIEKEKHDRIIVNTATNIPASIALGVPIFPVQLLVDRYPMESEEKVKLRQEEAKKIRDARKMARQIRDEDLTDVQRAQRRYVGDRAELGKRHVDGGGNLLKRYR